MEREKLGSQFYDLPEFYVEYGKFVELSEGKQNRLYDENEVYKTHPHTEECLPEGYIKPPEADWVPHDPTWITGQELPEAYRNLAFRNDESDGGLEVRENGHLDGSNLAVKEKPSESSEFELEPVEERSYPAPAIGGKTGLKALEYPVYRGKILNQGFYPKLGEVIECGLYDNTYFTQAKFVSVSKCYLKRGFFCANVKLVEGAASIKKRTLAYAFSL